jgi:hypothetical protein
LLTQLDGSLLIRSPYISLRFSLDKLQLDDQNPMAVCQTILLGRGPQFFVLEVLWPSDSPLSSVEFLSMTLQRIDIEIDAGFIADIMGLASSFDLGVAHDEIEPVKETVAGQVQLITSRWIEISAVYLVISYRGKTSRPCVYGQIPGYFTFIPKLKSSKLLLPGVIIAQLTDRIDSLASKLSGDYFTEVFHQGVRMLGKKGRLLSSLGITSRIASALKISLTTEMQNEIARFARRDSEVFDNRREIAGCFSSDSLQTLSSALRSSYLHPTTTITGLLRSVPEYSGLKTKPIAGYGYGRGVAGILTRAAIDTLDSVRAMRDAVRARIPRAFPGNAIARYDKVVARAQTVIAKQIGARERIRMTGNGLEKQLICFTDTQVVVVTVGGAIADSSKIADIQNAVASEGRVEIVRRVESPLIVIANGQKEAEQIAWYTLAQKRMIQLFSQSLLA